MESHSIQGHKTKISVCPIVLTLKEVLAFFLVSVKESMSVGVMGPEEDPLHGSRLACQRDVGLSSQQVDI